MHVNDFLRERPVGACLGAGGEDRGEVENVSEGGVGQDVVSVLVGGKVTDELEKAELMVDDQEHGVVFVESGEGLVACGREREMLVLERWEGVGNGGEEYTGCGREGRGEEEEGGGEGFGELHCE